MVTRSSDTIRTYLIQKIPCEGGWYWGWCDTDGEEIGDLADLTADEYFVIME